MTRILKTLLLWLLIASLPIRGLAAVDTSCGAPQGVQLSGGQESHQHMRDTAKECGTEQGMSSVVHHATHDRHLHKDLNGSGCGACFFGAVAPPMSLLPTAETRGTEAFARLPLASFTGFIPAGLERPPRHLFS